MNLTRAVALAAALVGVAALGAYARTTRADTFVWQQQASVLELLRWNASGCTTDTDCVRLEQWVQDRYHFEGQGV